MLEILKSTTFETWFSELRDTQAQARINARIRRLSGVSEMRIDYGPGYRVYYKQRGQIVALLLCGGDKSTQDRDIKLAIAIAETWKD